jgi:hypothetical protein
MGILLKYIQGIGISMKNTFGRSNNSSLYKLGIFLMNEESNKVNLDDAKYDQNGFSLDYGYVRVKAKHGLEKARGML